MNGIEEHIRQTMERFGVKVWAKEIRKVSFGAGVKETYIFPHRNSFLFLNQSKQIAYMLVIQSCTNMFESPTNYFDNATEVPSFFGETTITCDNSMTKDKAVFQFIEVFPIA